MIARTTRNLIGLSNITLRYSFCLNKALLNPYKHTTMMHSPHNMYVDLYDFGQYPQVIVTGSIPSREYQPIIISTIVSVLNSTYKTKLTQDDIVQNKQKTLKRFILKNLNNQTQSVEQVFSSVLNKLATDIIVKESRWTWIKQQMQRLNASSQLIKKTKPQTINDFINSYNALIQQLVLASTYGLSPHIPQAPTPLEKHYNNQMRASQNQGVDELNLLEGDKNNFINQAMAFIHKL